MSLDKLHRWQMLSNLLKKANKKQEHRETQNNKRIKLK